MLTGHGAELPYVFADVVFRYWGNFVNTGNPNTPQGSCAADGQCTVRTFRGNS